jgi:hypothetical protein
VKPIDFLTTPTERLGRLLSARRTNPRKFRLFAVACCRLDIDAITDPNCRKLIDLSERFADGAATEAELTKLRREVYRWAVRQPTITYRPELVPRPRTDPARDDGDKRWISIFGAYQTAKPAGRPVWGFMNHVPYRPLLADIIGPSPMTVAFSPEWRTDTAVSLARQMYESREFSAMPILADALQDAGCNDELVLSHCRDANQVHVRGCWVVDLVLGLS